MMQITCHLSVSPSVSRVLSCLSITSREEAGTLKQDRVHLYRAPIYHRAKINTSIHTCGQFQVAS